MNLLDDTTNEPSKFRTRNWVEINDESEGTYNDNSSIKFKTSIIRSSLCDYSDADIHGKGTLEVPNMAATVVPVSNNNKNVTFKNSAPFMNCISQINNTQVDGTQILI